MRQWPQNIEQNLNKSTIFIFLMTFAIAFIHQQQNYMFATFCAIFISFIAAE